MDQRFEKFKESRQPALKLSIACEDFFKEETLEQAKNAYRDYLLKRLRPAAEYLVCREDLSCLSALFDLNPFPADLLDQLLSCAVKEQRPAAFAWLLGKKKETYGFPQRDFSL